MHLLNLGILAHVDAGKTSLTERLLHSAGVIDEIGSVDVGNTRTDTLALERQRGITIKSAVVSFPLDGVTVNLIDTPGHPDFIAEVERVLGVLDGAVLVISAVEGVQAQTRVLMRTLRRLRIPTLLFVNKIDRGGARHEEVLREITSRLTPGIVPMGAATGLGTRRARFVPGPGPGAAGTLDVLTEHDDALLAAYLDDRVTDTLLRRSLVAQTRETLVHPVYFGSAATGAGVQALLSGIEELLPAADGDPDGPVSGTVFKVERGPAGEKIAYARMFSGTLRVRDRVPFGGAGAEGRVTAISVFGHGTDTRADAVAAGRIARLRGLGDIRIGDALGEPRKAYAHVFAPPTLETVVVPGPHTHRGALHLALTQLAEQDPLIGLRHDERRQETSVSLYGEVQKDATAGTTVGFTYEDRSRDGSTTLTWNPVPNSLPNVRRLVGQGQYGLLLWRSDGGPAPTELHLPASFPAASTTVVSDLGTVHAPPAYAATAPVGVAEEPGGTGSRRLLLTARDSGVLHYALVTNGATAPPADLLAAAGSELAAWAAKELS